MKYLSAVLVGFFLLLAGCQNPQNNKNNSHALQNETSFGVSDTAVETDEFDEDFAAFEEEFEQEKLEIDDPLESVNRIFFGFNDAVYFWIVKPGAELYADITPRPARVGIRNFFSNVSTPIRYVNCLLQEKGDAAGTELDRFLINTTEGILGFGDPAKDKHGIEKVDEDLGQTLAVAGFNHGFYLVLPLLGPSSLRDFGGKGGDIFLHPFFYLESCELKAALGATRFTNEMSFHLGEYEALTEEAVDPYILMRQAYIQYRKKQVEE